MNFVVGNILIPSAMFVDLFSRFFVLNYVSVNKLKVKNQCRLDSAFRGNGKS